MGVLSLLTILSTRGTSQDLPEHIPTARVTVVAVDGFGTPLPNTKVDSFVDEAGHDRVALFNSGPTASRVPFGKYRIAVHGDASLSYGDSTLEVDVASPRVLITAGLEWYGIDNNRITGILRGKLAGFPSAWRDWWCKASGLYSRLEYESLVTPTDLGFDFGEVPPGVYVVACVANHRFIALRTVRIAADAAPFTIDYKPNEDGEAVKR
jgi:hypothetical protein